MKAPAQLTIRYPEDLPIVGHREAILELIRANQVVVIAGETGSGKTTQIPKMCLEAGLAKKGKIACTQPRRVAALSISRRIAEELGVEWGHEVGAKIRFTDKTRRDTLVKVMTDGMLLTEIQGDPDMRAYSMIIVDEAHERSLNIDFLLGYLKQLLARRKDLKVIITSATIDTEAFSKAFDNAPILEVSGRLYPVETVYAPIDELLEDTGETTYIDGVVRSLEEIIDWNRPGDILVFLPGKRTFVRCATCSTAAASTAWRCCRSSVASLRRSRIKFSRLAASGKSSSRPISRRPRSRSRESVLSWTAGWRG
jgi:ATP-dependent helicase HrpA